MDPSPPIAYQPPPSDDPSDFARSVVKTLRSRGYDAYWAGGCVRDLLLGRIPKDYDVATSARPDQVRKVFGHQQTLPVGAAFGVIMVIGPRGTQPIEVATFRNDGNYLDGRHPESVTFSTAFDDAQRRDFTINGLFYDPITQETLDYVEGRQDLANRVVRAIGDPTARFREDKLRMLRAVRFAATFDFELDVATANAIRKDAEGIRQVSAERIASEMRRMLEHASRRRAVELLSQTGLLPAVFAGVPLRLSSPSGLDQANPMLAVLGHLDPATTFATAIAALLEMLTEFRTLESDRTACDPIIHALAAAWRLTRHELTRILWLTRTIGYLRQADEISWPTLQRILIHEGCAELLDWLQASVQAGLVQRSNLETCRRKLELPADQLNPLPILDGNDLRQHGIPPGKIYQLLLESVRDEQLEGRLLNRDEALRFVDSILERNDDGR